METSSVIDFTTCLAGALRETTGLPPFPAQSASEKFLMPTKETSRDALCKFLLIERSIKNKRMQSGGPDAQDRNGS
ncbi:hypothetical protein [Roseibium sp.]|uniref:hypothetical protein n=1 Tax=Roseibium sp. TaxID=1936156 RepID=UPI003A976F5E